MKTEIMLIKDVIWSEKDHDLFNDFIHFCFLLKKS